MKIVVATDGSRGSAAALGFAARLAGRDPGNEVVVLTVASQNGNGSHPSTEGPQPAAVKVQSEAQKVLDRAAREMEARGSAASYEIVSARRRDEVPEAISREADRLKADLVVVGSEGRDTLSEWVLGGVALRLIYVARRPVTVVRPPRKRKAS